MYKLLPETQGRRKAKRERPRRQETRRANAPIASDSASAQGFRVVFQVENQRINPMQSKTWSAVDVGRDSRAGEQSIADGLQGSDSRTRKARRCARDWAELAQPRHPLEPILVGYAPRWGVYSTSTFVYGSEIPPPDALSSSCSLSSSLSVLRLSISVVAFGSFFGCWLMVNSHARLQTPNLFQALPHLDVVCTRHSHRGEKIKMQFCEGHHTQC
jgi:hypothetical protein